MHEASLMKGLMKKIEAVAEENGATKIISIKVKLGALSHMSPEHFQEHFDQISPGTIAEGAHIEAEQMTDLSDPHAQEILLESVDVNKP